MEDNCKKLGPDALSLIASRFKVLADPLRLEILQELKGGDRCVKEIMEAVNAGQSNVSKQLKTLLDAQLVHRKQCGNTACYSIADPAVFDLCSLVCKSLKENYLKQQQTFQGL
jgi:DNA-binding transcriptional ArsR family regulator